MPRCVVISTCLKLSVFTHLCTIFSVNAERIFFRLLLMDRMLYEKGLCVLFCSILYSKLYDSMVLNSNLQMVTIRELSYFFMIFELCHSNLLNLIFYNITPEPNPRKL